jgi:hypothetical protein
MTAEEKHEARRVFVEAVQQYANAALYLSRAWEALDFDDAHVWANEGYPEALGDFPEHADAVSLWLQTLKGAK